MKIRNYILVVGFLLLGGAQLYAEPSKGLVPYSSSTVSSLPSSALPSISTVPVSTASLYTLGGLLALAGSYLGIKWLEKENDPCNQLRDSVKHLERPYQYNGGIPEQIDDPKEFYREHYAQSAWHAAQVSSRKRQKQEEDDLEQRVKDIEKLRDNTLTAALAASEKRNRRNLPSTSLIEEHEKYAQLSLKHAEESRKKREELLMRRNSSTSTSSVGSSVSLTSSSSGYSSPSVSSQALTSSDDEKESDECIFRSPFELDQIRDQRGRKALIIAQAAAKKREERENAQTVADMEATYQSISTDMVRKRNVSVSEGPSPASGRGELIGGDVVSVSEKDCNTLHRQYVKKRETLKRRLENGQKCHASSGEEARNMIIALVTPDNKDERERTVFIENPQETTSASDSFISCWSTIQQESFGDSSTYVSNRGSLVLALSPGIQQGCLFPDGVSHIEFFPEKEGVTVNLLGEKDTPRIEKSFNSYMKYGFSKVYERVAGAFAWVQKTVGIATDRLGKGWDNRVSYQNCHLRKAAAEGSGGMVCWAVANGADVNSPVRNNDGVGLRPLHIAAENGQTKIAWLLLKLGAEPCQAAWDEHRAGLLPLHIAAARGDREMLQLLMANSTDCSAKSVRLDTGEQLSALDLAKKYGHVAVVQDLFKAQYEQMFESMYGENPELVYLDTIWGAFGVDTPEVLIWKLHVLDCAYKEMMQKYEKKLQGKDLTAVDIKKLEALKRGFDDLYDKVDKKRNEVFVAISKGQSSPDELLKGMSAECAANKLSIEPEEYYQHLGYDSWEKGVEASFDDVRGCLEKKLASKDIPEREKATTFRQIGFFLNSKPQKMYFDCYLKLKNKRSDFLEIVVADSVPQVNGAEGRLSEINLGRLADFVNDRYQQVGMSDALMGIKDMQSKINRELNKRQKAQ